MPDGSIEGRPTIDFKWLTSTSLESNFVTDEYLLSVGPIQIKASLDRSTGMANVGITTKRCRLPGLFTIDFKERGPAHLSVGYADTRSAPMNDRELARDFGWDPNMRLALNLRMLALYYSDEE